MDISRKLRDAVNDHEHGFNCAQAVLKQFCEQLGLEPEKALMLASGFGGGMRIGTVCGAITGGLMALGMAYGFTDPQYKADINPFTMELIERFRATVGHVDCSAIIGIDTCDPVQQAQAKEQGIYADKCPFAIATAITIVYDLLGREG
ncbi:MAG: C-GCAxxG-C-C family protein [Candidatus Cloacimonas sp.]|jgi:C_GCAxxG_C_C family probable redox protein|nr:C-GCAxxG-C-C family protein [Candidatus Cloacimonas sp.]